MIVPNTFAEDLRSAWDAELDGRVGSFSLVLAPASGEPVTRDPDLPHYAASTVKTAVLCALLADRSAGLPAASGSIVVHDDFESAAGGSFRLLQSDDQDDETWARLGTEVDLMQLAGAMITTSSNIAMDLLVERLGFDSVRRFLAAAGLDRSLRLDRLIGDTGAQAAGLTNTVTAAGLAALIGGLADGTLLGREDADAALAVLARQEHREMIPAGLPAGTWSASKGGWVQGVNHDVALVRAASAPPYVLAVCTTHNLDPAAGTALVARLSAITWEHWNRCHG